MKVVMAIGSLGGGGAERVMCWLASSLAEAGDQVCVVTQRGSEYDFYRLDARVKRVAVGYRKYLPSSLANAAANAWRWRRALRDAVDRQQPDVVLSFIDRLNLSVLTALVGRGVPAVVAERTNPAQAPLGMVARSLRPVLYRRLASRVVVQSDSIAQWVRSTWRLTSVDVIPNAVIVGARYPEEAGIRRSTVLSVGRLSWEKGHDVLIDAWSHVHREFPEWRLRIIGDGVRRKALEAQVCRLGLWGSVEMPGQSQDVEAEYRAASVFVLPSRIEGFPNALLEAMALGCVPIASDTAGASTDVISPEVDGVLFPGGDAGALARQMARLMREDGLRRAWGSRAVKVRERFEPGRVLALWRRTLSEAAGLALD